MCWFCPCTAQPHVEFVFDKSFQPFTVELHLDCCAILPDDFVCLVPAKVPPYQIERNIHRFIRLRLILNKIFESHAQAVLDYQGNIKGNCYLVYARQETPQKFRIFGKSNKFFLTHTKSKPLDSKKAQNSSMVGSDKSLEEWTRSLLQSSRIEEENEREVILSLFRNRRRTKEVKMRKDPENVTESDTSSEGTPRIVIETEHETRKSTTNRGALKNISNNQAESVKHFSFKRKSFFK